VVVVVLGGGVALVAVAKRAVVERVVVVAVAVGAERGGRGEGE